MNLQENIQRIKEMMGLILEEDKNPTETIWYHGSVYDIKKEDLNPLHRETAEYKGDVDKQKWGGTGSSGGGVGIYFGKSKDALNTTGAKNYSGFHGTGPYKEGFIYEMKLKPNTNIKYDNSLHRIGKDYYNRLRQEGVDALTDGFELNLLNPDSVEYFKKVQYWKETPAIIPIIRGKEDKNKIIIFNNEEEFEEYMSSETGGYDTYVKSDGSKMILPKNDTISPFIYTLQRKWFDIDN